MAVSVRYDLSIQLAETTANPTLAGDQLLPDVVALSGGDYVVSWNTGAGDDNLGWRLFDDADNSVLASDTVLSGTDSSQGQPLLVALTNGGFNVVWNQQPVPGGTATDAGFFRYDASGAALSTGPESLQNDFHQGLSVATAAGGGFWTGYTLSTFGAGARSYDASGAVGTGFTPSGATGPVAATAIVELVNGDVALVYQPATGDRYRVAVWERATGTLGPAETLSANVTGDDAKPEIVALPTGGFAIAFNGLGGVQLSIFDDLGVRLKETTVAVSSSLNGTQRDPSLTVLPNGYLRVSWEGERNNGPASDEPPSSYIATKLFDESGTALPVSTTGTGTGNTNPITVDFLGALGLGSVETATLNDTSTVSVWKDPDTDGNGGRISVRRDIIERRSDGDAADDVIVGDVLNDRAFGNDGNDTITGGGGQDNLFGGAGDDEFLVMAEDIYRNSLITGGADTDTIKFVGDTDGALDLSDMNIVSIERVEFEDDAFHGLRSISFAGDVIINGGLSATLEVDGNSLNAAPNVLEILLDGGTIDVSGWTYADWDASSVVQINGGAGSETVTGGDIRETVFAGDGADTVQLGSGGDFASLGDGDDRAILSTSHSYFQATYNGGAGFDTLEFRKGTFDSTALNQTVLSGWEKFEFVSAPADVLVISLLAAQVPNDLLLDFTAASDTTSLNILMADSTTLDLTGLQLANVQSASGGARIVVTGDGDDEVIRTGGTRTNVFANGGDDDIEGSFANDLFNGGDGDDTVRYENAPGAITANLSLASSQETGGGGRDIFLSIENLVGSAFADTLTGNDEANHLNGLGGADALAGGLGNDEYVVDDAGDTVTEQAGEGYDRVYVDGLATYTLGDNLERLTFLDSGDHTATGNALDNRFDGNAGFDTFILDEGGADIFSGGLQLDTFDARAGTLGLDLNLITGVHGGDVAGDSFSSMEIFWGSQSASDTMVGGLARAKFYGFNGDDVLTGGSATVDLLDGGKGNDILSGLDGVDVIRGFTGNDTKTGGSGRDQFQYVFAGFDHDTITDFEDGTDYLRIFSAVADEVSDFTITGNGTSTVVLTLNDGTGENSITLNGAGGSNVTIDAGDFLFY